MSTKVGSRRIGGKQLFGVAVTQADAETSNEFMGVSTLDDLIMFGLMRPSRVDKAKARDFKDAGEGAALEAAHVLREQIQRRFDKNRMARAQKFAAYIDDVRSGRRLGKTPPLTLYCPQAGRVDEDGFILTLPSVSPLVNLDGETQTEGRFILRDGMPETGELPVPFVLHHGISVIHGGAIMHDYNRYAYPVKETAVAALHQTGAATAIVNKALDQLEVERKTVQRFKRKPTKKEVVSYECLLAGVAGATFGLAGPSWASALSIINNGGTPVDEPRALNFLQHAIGLAQTEREIAVSAPQVWAMMAGIYREHHMLVSREQWLAAISAYAEKIEEKGVLGAIKKRASVLHAVGIVKEEGAI